MSAQDLTEDEEAEAVDEDVVDDVTAEDEDDEAEVEDDENTELVRFGLTSTSLLGPVRDIKHVKCFIK